MQCNSSFVRRCLISLDNIYNVLLHLPMMTALFLTCVYCFILHIMPLEEKYEQYKLKKDSFFPKSIEKGTKDTKRVRS